MTIENKYKTQIIIFQPTDLSEIMLKEKFDFFFFLLVFNFILLFFVSGNCWSIFVNNHGCRNDDFGKLVEKNGVKK